MIRHLRKKISFLIAALCTVIWIGMLWLFCSSSYQQNLITLREDFNAIMREVKLKKFIKTEGAAVDFGDISYAVFSFDKQTKQPVLLFDTFTDVSETELAAHLHGSDSHWLQRALSSDYTRFTRFSKHTKTRYTILVSTRTAVEATMPVYIVCVLLAVGGAVLFFYLAMLLSGWLVKPIEDMLDSEKTFISNASHELKTPLSVIRANTQLLESEVTAGNKHLGYIRQETDRMITLVNQMLTLARLEAPQAQEQHAVFSLSSVLLDVIYPMESVAYEKSITLRTDIAADIKTDGNESQLQTLISILLNNALSYTPPHGTIRVQAYRRSHKCYLSVANTGDPIPDEIRARLFERFFRADEAHSGDDGHFGLGLSIAHSIAANHSGRITVRRDGDMNVFSVILPAVS